MNTHFWKWLFRVWAEYIVLACLLTLIPRGLWRGWLTAVALVLWGWHAIALMVRSFNEDPTFLYLQALAKEENHREQIKKLVRP